MPTSATQTKSEFARRLNEVADFNRLVPAKNYGRYVWVSAKLAERKVTATPEAVRRWFGGASKASDDKMAALAKVLDADFQYLAYGLGGDHPPTRGTTSRPVPIRAQAIAAGRHLAIGLVASGGAAVTEVPETGPVHVRAQIKGAEYAFHGVLGESDGDRWLFEVPIDAKETVVLGIVPIGPMRFQVFELDWDTLGAKGEQTAGPIKVAVGLKTNPFREVSGFDKRL